MSVNLYPQSIKPTVDLEDGVTVYVPGYAYIGPEEPTLCTSVSEFEGLYGSTPYLFEADEKETKISKGSPEKGYLYAKSLLDSGINILFHRYKADGSKTAVGAYLLKYCPKDSEQISEFYLVTQATSFGKAYAKTKVTLNHTDGSLFSISVKDREGNIVSDDLLSFDPTSSLYLKLSSYGLIKFKTTNSDGGVVDLEDSIMAQIAELTYLDSTEDPTAGKYTIQPLKKVDGEYVIASDGFVTLEIDDNGPSQEFTLSDMLTSLGDSTSTGLLAPLKDFERYPSVAYITSGGYYLDSNTDAAATMMAYARAISAIALIDLNKNINSQADWVNAKTLYAKLTGEKIAKARAAAFVGCNSFSVSPYRLILGDSFNYLKSLGENLKSGIKAWIPVANDPNGVSPLGYDTTQKISTDLAETMAEGKIGVSVNPLIYSKSAGGYKIMGNRTLYPNDGVLEPNSFLNISVIVTRVERAARQIANKLKIVSTNPDETFLKFKQSVGKTIDAMTVNQDGVISYRIKHLPKTQPATINIQIHLVVLEGIETFNIYIPYELQLD